MSTRTVSLEGGGLEESRYRCENCGCSNIGGRCHGCGSMGGGVEVGSSGPWLFDGVCREIAGIERWLRDSAEFRTETAGEDSFCIARPPEDVVRWVSAPLRPIVRTLLGGEMHLRQCFGRLSTEEVDAKLRIHTDAGMGAQYASVLYVSGGGIGHEVCGTGFFEHVTHGRRYALGGDTGEHDRLLREDADDLSQWEPIWIAPMVPNRVVLYPADRFHGRWPAAGWGSGQADGRVVIAVFFDVVDAER